MCARVCECVRACVHINTNLHDDVTQVAGVMKGIVVGVGWVVFIPSYGVYRNFLVWSLCNYQLVVFSREN